MLCRLATPLILCRVARAQENQSLRCHPTRKWSQVCASAYTNTYTSLDVVSTRLASPTKRSGDEARMRRGTTLMLYICVVAKDVCECNHLTLASMSACVGLLRIVTYCLAFAYRLAHTRPCILCERCAVRRLAKHELQHHVSFTTMHAPVPRRRHTALMARSSAPRTPRSSSHVHSHSHSPASFLPPSSSGMLDSPCASCACLS